MEQLPVAIIGNLLSMMPTRDAVMASTTCREWREAFHYIHSVSFSHITISAIELNHLLMTCPIIETLAIIDADIKPLDPQGTVELRSHKLKSVYLEAINLEVEQFTLVADKLENLHMRHCYLELFTLIGKGKLKNLTIHDTLNFVVDENLESLEVVDISCMTIILYKFFQMISGSSNLRGLRLWEVSLDVVEEDANVNLERIAACFPRLAHLSLHREVIDAVTCPGLQDSFHLQSVVVLEFEGIYFDDFFSKVVGGMLDRCPNLKKLIIHGTASGLLFKEELKRKYMHLDVVLFEYA
ncbi:hypothetical protein Ancab_011268 [Ancistrocladus abbreviatus]